MDSLNLNKHISGQFNAELESIRTQSSLIRSTKIKTVRLV